MKTIAGLSITMLVLAACSNATSTEVPAPNAQSPSAELRETTSPRIDVTSAPTLPAVPRAASPSLTPLASAPPDRLPQGMAPSGHFVLGRSDSPVTLIDYSDFM